jgi:hypothetical protein
LTREKTDETLGLVGLFVVMIVLISNLLADSLARRSLLSEYGSTTGLHASRDMTCGCKSKNLTMGRQQLEEVMLARIAWIFSTR